MSNLRPPGGVPRSCAAAGGGALWDFGPTLASEHLAADDGVHAETLRRWLRAAGQPAVRKRRRTQRREPNAHFGELVQMDGSFHKWLEDAGARVA